jgi:hypothetical protein
VPFFAASALAASPVSGCDYYQTVLMGVLCQNTIDLGLGVGIDQREIKQAYMVPNFYSSFSKTNINFQTETASVSITPLSWLQVTLASNLVTQLWARQAGQPSPAPVSRRFTSRAWM